MAKKTVKKSKSVKIKVGVVVSEFNEFITKNLLSGCLDELKKLGVKKADITVISVPGAFEIPAIAQKLAFKKSIQAVICLGCVIRGDTYHFEIIADSAAQGIMQASLKTEKPIIMGVLSTDTIEQAYKRSEEDGDNKGRDAAITAIEMIQRFKEI